LTAVNGGCARHLPPRQRHRPRVRRGEAGRRRPPPHAAEE